MIKHVLYLAMGLFAGSLLCCKNQEKEVSSQVGSISKFDDRLDEILDPETVIEVLCEGFDWSEGPLWLETEQKLIFSDVPTNTVYSWSGGNKAQVYLSPSGFTGEKSRPGEMGSNGLTLNAQNQLILCQHGDRRIAIMNAPLHNPKAEFITKTNRFGGQRFNSPNDLAFDADGFLYFTDPPYGLVQGMEDSTKDLSFQGVFRVSPEGKTDLLVADLSRPNGIAFSPDYSKAYVANSDPERAVWMEYRVTREKQFKNGKVFFDATNLTSNMPGLPDGLKVNSDGILFATGPGGVFIFDPEGTLLGKINVENATSNCALGSDEKELFITADSQILRVKLK